MGNYIIKYRVPTPTPDEQERNHPSYYDWTIPKWNPFLTDELLVKSEEEPSCKKGVDEVASDKELVQTTNVAKEALTSKIDMNSTKPPDVGVHKAGKSTSGGAKHQPLSSIKRVDSTRPHTIDPKKYGSLETQAAAKAATNIHAIKTAAKKASNDSR